MAITSIVRLYCTLRQTTWIMVSLLIMLNTVTNTLNTGGDVSAYSIGTIYAKCKAHIQLNS